MKDQRSVGHRSVTAAVIGNSIVAVMKVAGWFFTGSSVMLSEGIHSIADTTNQSLLFLGIKRSERPADQEFQYGYRQERFFWALISACGIFFLGAGVTLYQGVNSLIHGEIFEFNPFMILILILSVFFEGYALVTAIKEAKHLAKGEQMMKYLKHSGDPTILAVIYEDTAALAGITIALCSILLTEITGQTWWDGVGSVLVGLLLAFVAISLISINRKFLLNRSVPTHIREKIATILEGEELIDEVHDLKTVMIGTDGYIVKAEVEINGHLLAEKIFSSRDFKREYKDIKDYDDFCKYSYALCDEATRTLGREIDELEKKITSEIPKVKHIDIETN